MADFVMVIADEDVNRVISALCASTMKDVSYANALQAVMDYISNIVQSHEQQAAIAAITVPSPVQLSGPVP